MQSIQALRERRNALAADLRKLLDDNPGAKWNTELGAKYDAGLAEIDDHDAQIKRIHALNERVADEAALDRLNALGGNRGADPTDPKALVRVGFANWLRGGDQAVSAEQWAAIRATMSTTTGSQGGYTVPTEVATRVADALKAYGGMRQVAEIFGTQNGNDINYPTSDGTSEVGELIAQNTTATAADPTFGVVTLSTYKYSSKIIAVPFELLQDTVIDMESFIALRIAARLGRIQNQHFTTGTGSGQPNGLVTAASSGVTGTTGQTLTVIYNDLVDLIHSVDPAYRMAPGKVGFMMHDSSVKVIRKIKDSNNRPLWMPDDDTPMTNGVPGTLLGYPVYVNQDVATMAANAKSILFGNYAYYKIRDVMDLTMFRFTDSAYTKLGQVGFLAWQRAGGTFVDVGGAVKYYANSAT
jgi:HK97 family phage major capsid protein